jgi:hypothetical protein
MGLLSPRGDGEAMSERHNVSIKIQALLNRDIMSLYVVCVLYVIKVITYSGIAFCSSAPRGFSHMVCNLHIYWQVNRRILLWIWKN